MTVKALPSQDLLHEILRYDEVTGQLFWRPRPIEMFSAGGRGREANQKTWNIKNAGREAFTAMHSMGYRHGTIMGQHFFAHRIIWKIVTGEEPLTIDHVNGIKKDNRICNLRSVTHCINMRNQKKRITNTHGQAGIVIDRRDGAWQAAIGIGGKTLNLGRFKTKRDAIDARILAEERLGYHPYHGRRL